MMNDYDNALANCCIAYLMEGSGGNGYREPTVGFRSVPRKFHKWDEFHILITWMRVQPWYEESAGGSITSLAKFAEDRFLEFLGPDNDCEAYQVVADIHQALWEWIERQTTHMQFKDRMCACDNCGAIYHENHLAEIKKYSERVDPGSVVPAGACPDCEALCYLLLDDGITKARVDSQWADVPRPWICPDCSFTASCSYRNLSITGTPRCPDCDVEMVIHE